MPSVPSPFNKSRKPRNSGQRVERMQVPVEEAIEHCRVFVDGESLPGEYTTAEAQATLQEYGRGFIWVGLHEPLEHQMTRVAEVFGIHELIVEDAVQAHQRPKVERYDDQLFIVARSVSYRDHEEVADKRQVVSTGEVQLVVGPDFIVTVRHNAKLPNLAYSVAGEEELMSAGPFALAWKVLDMMVDSYMATATLLGEEVDSLEEEVFSPGRDFNIDKIYLYKREILEMKHSIDPLSDALRNLTAVHADLIDEEIRSYLRDVHDNELVVKDDVASYNERLSSLIDASAAKISLQQNSDMRTISAVVGMAAAPTLIAGIYGMNFQNMPELNTQYGYYVAVGAMVAMVLAMFWWFRRNNWL